MPNTIQVIMSGQDAYLKWLDKIKKGSGDARPLWIAMTPKIIEFVNHQFSETSDSGKRWKKLTIPYKKWKAKKGFPTAIGVRTGKLKRASGTQAIKQLRMKSLVWRMDASIPVENGRPYAKYFHEKRPIYKNVDLRVNSFLSKDIKNFPNRVGFTYKWLRKSLEPFV